MSHVPPPPPLDKPDPTPAADSTQGAQPDPRVAPQPPPRAVAATPVQPPPPDPRAAPQPPPPIPAPASHLPPPHGPPQFVPASRTKLAVVTNTYDHEQARWGLGDMFVSLATYFFGSIAIILVVVLATNSDDFLQGPWLLVAVVGPHALLLSHLFWVRRKKGTTFANDFQMRIQWSDVGLGLGLFFAGLFSAGIVAVVITQVFGEPPTALAVELAQESGEDGLTLWLYLFAILGTTFVPVVEELVYRGLFWSALEKRGMNPWAILVVTSAVFAIIHLEPIRTAVLFVVGLAIGVGRLVTGRVGASIATHVFINAMAMVATLIQIA